jgi:signal transduction histidine kinase/ActR/RegA family two-component response regulator
VDLRTVPVFDDDGLVRGVIEIARDITEQKKVEAQLLHAQKMEAVGTLAGGIAHDFNNILTTIIGYGSLLQMKLAGDSPFLRNVDHIMSAADRAKVLTQGLLSYSRREVLDLRPVELNNILKKIDQLLSRIIGEDIELKVMPSADDLYLLADAGELEQVLMNLATNSRDAMPRGGSLLIGARKTAIDAQFIAAHGFGAEGRYALLTVSDTGEGMEEATRKRIFEPFFTTKGVGKGTGLGLSIAYGIVKQHSGFINVYSEPGNGTTIRIYLPLIDRTPEESRSEVRLPEHGKGETILLVEDNKEIRSFLSELLVDYGYRVIEAVDGMDGVEKFRSHSNHIQLLLLDIIMPRKNGKETFEEIRSAAPDIKALFMSGYTADIISRKGIDTEGLEFIAKPLYPHAILGKVREVLDQQPNGGRKR